MAENFDEFLDTVLEEEVPTEDAAEETDAADEVTDAETEDTDAEDTDTEEDTGESPVSDEDLFGDDAEADTTEDESVMDTSIDADDVYDQLVTAEMEVKVDEVSDILNKYKYVPSTNKHKFKYMFDDVLSKFWYSDILDDDQRESVDMNMYYRWLTTQNFNALESDPKWNEYILNTGAGEDVISRYNELEGVSEDEKEQVADDLDIYEEEDVEDILDIEIDDDFDSILDDIVSDESDEEAPTEESTDETPEEEPATDEEDEGVDELEFETDDFSALDDLQEELGI